MHIDLRLLKYDCLLNMMTEAIWGVSMDDDFILSIF